MKKMSDIGTVGTLTWFAWFFYLFIVATPVISLNWTLFFAFPIIGSLLWVFEIVFSKLTKRNKSNEVKS